MQKERKLRLIQNEKRVPNPYCGVVDDFVCVVWVCLRTFVLFFCAHTLETLLRRNQQSKNFELSFRTHPTHSVVTRYSILINPHLLIQSTQ